MGRKQKSKYRIRERYQNKLQQPQDLDTNVYLDHLGYYRFRNSGILVHRVIAHKEYLAHPEKYPLPFGAYTVHHKDGCRTNNRPNNLEILSREEHKELHPHLTDEDFDPRKKERENK